MTTGPVSSRRLTQQSGRYIRETPGSRSLERGLALLRAFRPGTSMLTNAELAERTGLPRPTVSRLTRSLVDSGFLAFDLRDRAYRLTAVFLSLAQAFQNEAPELDAALPLMKRVAEGHKINVGLAVPDRYEMIYLSSVRESRLGIFRHIFAGSRSAIELTALGRAYLASLTKPQRQTILEGIAPKYGPAWPVLQKEIDDAVVHVRQHGYCVREWPGMVSIAAPLTAPDHAQYSANISFAFTTGEYAGQVERYAPMLLDLTRQIQQAWQAGFAARPPSN